MQALEVAAVVVGKPFLEEIVLVVLVDLCAGRLEQGRSLWSGGIALKKRTTAGGVRI